MLTIVRRGLEGLLILLVLGALGLAASAWASPLAGGGLFAVRSESMEPALSVGDLVIVQGVDPWAVRTDDVITVKVGNGATITHRVTAVVATDDGPMFQTRGDANSSPDPVYVRADQVLGRVAGHAPWIGFLLAMLSMPSGLAALFSIGATLLTAIWLLDEVVAADEDDELDGLDAEPGPSVRAVRP